MVSLVLATNQASFSDDELPLEGSDHTLVIHIVAKCEDMIVSSIYWGLKAAETRGSIASLIDGYLSKFMKLSFSEFIFIQSVSMCLGFLFSQP